MKEEGSVSESEAFAGARSSGGGSSSGCSDSDTMSWWTSVGVQCLPIMPARPLWKA